MAGEREREKSERERERDENDENGRLSLSVSLATHTRHCLPSLLSDAYLYALWWYGEGMRMSVTMWPMAVLPSVGGTALSHAERHLAPILPFVLICG